MPPTFGLATSPLSRAWHRARRLPAFIRRLRRAAAPRFFRWLTSMRWRLRSGSASRHGLPRRLVVSLTSFPPRFDVLPLTLKCLLLQSIRPDALVLWIADGDLPRLPPEVLDLQHEGLEIRPCPDIGSFKKIVPALEAFPDAFIATADDDLHYPPTWLEELVRASDDDRTVTCHHAHRIRTDARGAPLSYNDWEMEIADQQRGPRVFPISGGGILYPPGVLSPETLDSERFLACCPTADDVWLYWMLRRNGGQARRAGELRDLVPWPGSQRTSLWSMNRHANDRQIEAMIAQYGLPDLGESEEAAADASLVHFEHNGTAIVIEGVADDDLIFSSIAARGAFYEDDLLEYMSAALGSRNTCIVDVGANIGNHAVYFGRFLADLVVAIEANPRVVPVLRRNLERNRIRYRIHEVGVAAAPGQAVLELPPEHRANIGATRLRVDESDASAGAGAVAVTTLDALRADIEAQSSDGRINAIKLDVEGMEPAVLRGASGLLAKHAPELFVEAMNDDKLREVEDVLHPLGYIRVVAHASTPVWHFGHRRNLSPARVARIALHLLAARAGRFARRVLRRLRR